MHKILAWMNIGTILETIKDSKNNIQTQHKNGTGPKHKK